MLIKNVLPHPDDLHDGRPIDAYSTVELTDDELALEHYQSRIRDGLMVVVPVPIDPPTVDAIKTAIDAAPEQEREALKAQLRATEQERDEPRKGVLDATKSAEKETAK